MDSERVLNVGCGSDLSVGTDWIDLYPSDKRVLKVDAGKDFFPYPAYTFDRVYSRHLVEILPTPLHFFDECFRVLKRRGKLTVIAPNATGADTILGNNSGYDNKILGEHQPSFLIFTKPILENWFRHVGFSNVRSSFITTKPTVDRDDLKRNATLISAVGSVFPKLNSQIICEGIR